MDGAPFASAGRSGAGVVEAPIPTTFAPGRAEQSRPRRQGRSYSGALHLDALNHARSTECGPKADGMGAGVSGGLMDGATFNVSALAAYHSPSRSRAFFYENS